MTFDRFSDYVKTIVAAAVCGHLFINELIIELLLGRPDLRAHPFPVALPICVTMGVYGWWLVYKSPLPPRYRTVVTECPTCHQNVVEKVRVE